MAERSPCFPGCPWHTSVLYGITSGQVYSRGLDPASGLSTATRDEGAMLSVGGRSVSADLGLEAGLDLFGELGADTRHGRDLLNWGVSDALRRPEHTQKRTLPRGPDALHIVEGRADRPLRTQVAVVGDRESVRFVADALNQV